MTEPTPLADIAAEASLLLATGEYYEALRCLNACTPHRFTALYKREDDRAWNVLLYDAQHPYTPQFPEVAVSETYCSMVLEGRQVIVVENALTDPRLVDHAARGVVRSYCGAPVGDAAGELFGTLCHFDFAPLATPDGVADLMERLAREVREAAVMQSLQADIVRRMDNLAATLSMLASGMNDNERAAVFEELAAPVHAVLARLPAETRAVLADRLRTMEGSFVAA